MLSAPPSAVNALTQGWGGAAIAYGAVQLPLAAAMVRARAALSSVMASPVIALPLMLGVSAGMAFAAPALHAAGIADHSLLCDALTLGASAAAGFTGGHLLAAAPARSDEWQVRGAVVLGEPAAAAGQGRAPRRGRSAGRARGAGVTLAGIAVPAADETKHLKILGSTGTGKSTAIAELLSGALERGDRAVIADPDGGYLRRFREARRGDVVLSPFEPAGRKWDLFAEIESHHDIEQLALALIPDHEGADRSWRGYARTLFAAVAAQARRAGVSDVRDLFELLVVARREELKVLVTGTPAQPFFEEHNERMLDSIRSVTSSAVGALQYVAEQDAEPLSVRRWVRSGRGVLFVPYRAGQIAALRSSISAWMRLAIFEAMSREGEAPLWFVVDELDALGQIDGLKDALARLRKFNGRCVLGFQSVAQVSSTYGRGEAQTIVENCGNTLILRCSASEQGGTSQFASRLIGQREVVRTSRSRSRRTGDLFSTVTEGEQRLVEPAVLDSEIERLPDLAGYLKLASAADWRRVTLRLPAHRGLRPSAPAREPLPTGSIERARAFAPPREPSAEAPDLGL
jgi:type IV secretory pathway TraG/TraD family ATPase VirD4